MGYLPRTVAGVASEGHLAKIYPRLSDPVGTVRIKNTVIDTVAAMSSHWGYFCKCSFGLF